MKKETILIVDDEEKNVRLLKAILAKENYNLVSSLNGEEALKLVNEMNVDLVLLDIMMMGMNGYTVCKKIKSNEKTSDIPILMLTVLTGKEDRIKAMKAGADYFMSKPVVRTELLERINSLLRHDNWGGQSLTDSCGSC